MVVGFWVLVNILGYAILLNVWAFLLVCRWHKIMGDWVYRRGFLESNSKVVLDLVQNGCDKKIYVIVSSFSVYS